MKVREKNSSDVTEETIERLASELHECCARVQKVREKMRRLKPGAETDLSSLTELSISALELQDIKRLTKIAPLT